MRARPSGFPEVGFHEGELAVQGRAGVRLEAGRLSGMLASVELRGGIVTFLADRSFAAITARDADGSLWTSPLVDDPGFLRVTSPTRVRIDATFLRGDPLERTPIGQSVGLVVMEFAARRRVRINGTLVEADSFGLTVEVDQAYGNCPQDIHRRNIVPDEINGRDGNLRRDVALSVEDVAQITTANTFFLGTTHPDRGSDASHRGGPAGFVEVAGNDVSWPDFAGNNMFNSFGNLAVDPSAALLFVDFETGRTLQLSGTAAVEWGQPDAGDNGGGTDRRARFHAEHVVSEQRGSHRKADSTWPSTSRAA
jgi:predicted pyridoxine 5'-phosphate oxidase superfamily flavin-nucleotide-binding protein